VAAKFSTVYKGYSASGQNDEDNFGKFSGGNALMEYMFFLFKNNSMVLDLVNRDLGSAGVQSDTAGDGGSGGGGGGGSGGALLRSAGRVNKRPGTEAMASLVECSSAMAKAMDRQAAAAQLVALSKTLRNLKEACAPTDMIECVEEQIRESMTLKRPRVSSGSENGAEVDEDEATPALEYVGIVEN